MEANAASLSQQAIYGSETQVIVCDNDYTIYKMENETGEGIITCYPVFPGIELLYNDIHMADSTGENKLVCNDVIEINHCREGRFECEFFTGGTAFLGEGDLAVNMLSNSARGAWFPLSHYHGISIVIDIPTATQTLSQVSSALGGFPFDLYAIRNVLCADNSCFIMRSTDSIQHIFSELYTAPKQLQDGYFKVKVMELLLFLSSPDIPLYKESRPYFYKEQVDTIREIKIYLSENLDRHITLNELSEKFNIPLTTMKLCFKGVYGSPINTYMQKFRMSTATTLFRTTNESVTAVAVRVGYKNSSKFAQIFKEHTGYTPTEYKKLFCLKGATSV